MSEEPKSIRERYILVAAIDMVTRAGVWNIYVAEGVRNQSPTPLVTRRTYEVERICQ
jgi:hypothetical protein